jgi:hypothetical protein
MDALPARRRIDRERLSEGGQPLALRLNDLLGVTADYRAISIPVNCRYRTEALQAI